jgi:protein gp37
MAENSNIEWTTHTFNPWRGCTKVSPGCAHCYAETGSHRNPGTLGVWGPNGTRVVAAESQWRKVEKWQEAAAFAQELMEAATPEQLKLIEPGSERCRVFCASLADVFEDWKGDMINAQGKRLWRDRIAQPNTYFPETPEGSFACLRPLTMDDVRERLFHLITHTPNLDWLLLTKRPENIAPMLWGKTDPKRTCPARNVWFGTSVENQATAVSRIPELLEIPARVRFLSMEPLLGPVTLGPFLRGINWVIIGGESGPHARSFNLDWARSIVKECQDAGVPVFVKQLGALIHARDGIDPLDQFPCPKGSPRSMGQGPDYFTMELKLLDSKGGDPLEWPEDLRVRQFPVTR